MESGSQQQFEESLEMMVNGTKLDPNFPFQVVEGVDGLM
jgi:hypothetical protein